MATRPTLRGMADVRAFFRTNPTPIHFVGPTAFNLLGLDRWVRSLYYVNYYDSFQNHHPRVFVPHERPYRAFDVGRGDLQLPARPQGGASPSSSSRGRAARRRS